MLFYYKCQDKIQSCEDKILFSNEEYIDFIRISEEEAKSYSKNYFALTKMDCKNSRRSFCVTHPSLLFLKEESLELLRCNYLDSIISKKSSCLDNIDFNNSSNHHSELMIPDWISEAIIERRVTSINTEYPNWKDVLIENHPTKWKVNVVGLGDVGGIMLTGLRLLGGVNISSLGLYDRDENRINRWKYELSQILSADMNKEYPYIQGLKEEEVFDCDMFVFCVSVGVPEVGKEKVDVRLAQLEGNSKIVAHYAKIAREKAFKGIFAVVSDPVDLLCMAAFNGSNKNENGDFDFKGLAPEQIRGYGLGVMNARAAYYAMEKEETKHYVKEGRAFGPHGEGLIITDSIENYNAELSDYLTEKTKKANLDVRGTGFKPYIAPALSSGALSLLDTINHNWHYSANFIGGAYMGCRNRYLLSGMELETYDMGDELFLKLKNTYDSIKKFS